LSQKIIIDTDPGIGDAVALAVALADPNLDVLGLTATAGVVSGDDASRNVQAIVERLDPPKWPRLGSSSEEWPVSPLASDGETGLVACLNGVQGLGDYEFEIADLHHRRASAKLMIDIVRANPHAVTLLTLGPLTNVEIAMERAPDFLDLLKGMVCLGGSVAAGGDVTAAAEFNIYANPQAARNVLRSPATKTLVPLDISNRLVLTYDQFARMSAGGESPACCLLTELLPFSFRAHHQHLGLEGVPLREIMALASISQPRLFEPSSMAVDVETGGELTCGMTVFDRRGTQRWKENIDVLLDVDIHGVMDYFRRIIRGSR